MHFSEVSPAPLQQGNCPGAVVAWVGVSDPGGEAASVDGSVLCV